MGFGVKVSLPGYSVETAADSNLYFNSDWPIMKIDEALSGSYTMGATSNSTTVNHNLGYPPFTMVFSNTFGYQGPAGNVNSTSTTITTGNGDSGHYYVFRNPLNQNFQAPQLNLSAPPAGTSNEDFGIKFSKPGRNASSTDLRDFTIHSATRSLMVYQTVYQPIKALTDQGFSADFGLDYINTLPYDPVFFAFYSADNLNFVPLSAVSATAPKVDFNAISGNPFINNGITNIGYGVFYVMLDPYQTTNQINVTL
jgi:hypothetical protein